MTESSPTTALPGHDVALTVNGRKCRLRDVPLPSEAPQLTLLTALRNDLGLNGPKYGCGLGECGACTVLIDDMAARACVIPLAGVAGRAITTLEGLAGPESLHPVQQAFIDAQAAQCGYCLNGMVMMAVALLAHTPSPSVQEVRRALSGNICRCGTHIEIVAAVMLASQRMEQRLPTSATTGWTPSVA